MTAASPSGDMAARTAADRLGVGKQGPNISSMSSSLCTAVRKSSRDIRPSASLSIRLRAISDRSRAPSSGSSSCPPSPASLDADDVFSVLSIGRSPVDDLSATTATTAVADLFPGDGGAGDVVGDSGGALDELLLYAIPLDTTGRRLVFNN